MRRGLVALFCCIRRVSPVVCMLSAFGTACTSKPARLAAQPKLPEPTDIAVPIYDGGLREGWAEWGSAVHDVDAGSAGPAKIRFDASGGWVLGRSSLDGRYGGVLFIVKEPYGEGEFLQVRLGSSSGHAFRGVKLKPDHCTPIEDGWIRVFIPMAELDPDGAPFDRVIFESFRPFTDWVLLDKIALASRPPNAPEDIPPALGPGAMPAAKSPRRIEARLACDTQGIPISPYIYGIAAADDGWDRLGATARRWGGNPASRYNWEANVSNRADDWFFENGPMPSYGDFFAATTARGMSTALTVPMIGWVARDATSYSFPVSIFGPQSRTDPWHPDAGNGVTPAGAEIAPGPPTRTSVEAPPDWAKRWIRAIRANDAKSGKRSVYEYILDNEPMLWSKTHRDVRPEPLGYDELLDRTIRYGRAIRDADPDGIIAGPAEWGWSGYFFSAKDLAPPSLHTDRRSHGDVPLVEWYLTRLAQYERTTGTRILDVLDLHYYPQAANVYGNGNGGVDRATQLLRLRATRSLWDPTYVDESWIKDTVRLLPRMKQWIDRDYPGRGISIGEWSFGGQQDITGALATAEALGRFAQFGVNSAFYWTSPPPGSPSSFAFLAYRNFDGNGGRFLDWYVPTGTFEGASLFASRDEHGKHFVLVAINLGPDTPVSARIDLAGCGSAATARAYTYTGGKSFVADAVNAKDSVMTRELPPWSITVFDVRMSDSLALPAK